MAIDSPKFHLFMLIFLYGEDSYRSRQKLNQIKEKAKKADPSGINISILRGQNLEFGKIKKAISYPPFLAKKRLIILENILKEGNKNLNDKISEFLKEQEILDTSVIIFREDNLPDKRKELFKTLIKKAESENFEFLTGWQLNQWIKKEVEFQGAKIERRAVDLLASYVGSDLWQMKEEIQKLILFKKRDGNQLINSSDIEILVKASLDDNIFNFIDAILFKNKKQALKLLHDQLESGQNENLLLSMITYQFRNVLLVSDLLRQKINQYQISKEAKIHPYVVKKILQNINKFNFSRLKEIYQRLLETDNNLKRTGISPILSLDMLVCELCN